MEYRSYDDVHEAMAWWATFGGYKTAAAMPKPVPATRPLLQPAASPPYDTRSRKANTETKKKRKATKAARKKQRRKKK